MVGKSPIVKLILECVYAGGVSKSALLCMPYSYQNISFHIKKLLDNGWLQLYGRGGKKRYRLLPIAVDFLFEKDELRYAAYDTLLNCVRTDERAMNIGDSAVLFKLSEFGANIDDKPLLPANTSYMKDGAFYATEIYQNYYHISSFTFPLGEEIDFNIAFGYLIDFLERHLNPLNYISPLNEVENSWSNK